jgi:hypothetical protein
LLKLSFTAADADPSAKRALGNQRAFLDPRVPEKDRRVVFLHVAGVAENCGPSAHLRTLASYGFHVFSQCYMSDYGLTHSGDKQHAGHLAAFAALRMPGPAVDVDEATPPFGRSHRLVTAVASEKPHSAVHAGKMSPEADRGFLLHPVWRYLYGVDN